MFHVIVHSTVEYFLLPILRRASSCQLNANLSASHAGAWHFSKINHFSAQNGSVFFSPPLHLYIDQIPISFDVRLSYHGQKVSHWNITYKTVGMNAGISRTARN